jgi:hypothetical protein
MVTLDLLNSEQELPNLEIEVLWKNMAWSVPRYSRGKVDKAGEELVKFLKLFPPDPLNPFEVRGQEAMEIMNNWRSSHLLPLTVIRKTLKNRALRVNGAAIVSERIKRLASIEKKLCDNHYRNLKLTQIEDLGGCRAVMPTITDALALSALYAQSGTKQEFVRSRDYISNPKEDGYRSIHLIYKYKSDREEYRIFNGHRIEIQIRSRLQHAWATAVEMLWTFAKIPLRMAPGQVETITPRSLSDISKWRRFFALMGSAIAIRESQPIIPGVPFDKDELRSLTDQLHVLDLLPTWTVGISSFFTSDSVVGADAAHFLLQLDLRGGENKFRISGFRQDQLEEAFGSYMLAEQASPPENYGEPPSTNVVLVSADSVAALRNAYPNYYGDTAMFLHALTVAIA